MSGAPDEQLAEAFAAVARQLQAEPGTESTYRRITAAAVETVEGCDHAALSLVRRHGPITTVAATSPVPGRVDSIQYSTGQGPCLDAISDPHSTLVEDLTAETRWPRFSERAARETGIRSMLTFQLFSHGDVIGGLNHYSTAVAAFTERSRAVGAILAAHAAIAMSAADDRQNATQLTRALHSNRRIGIAIGILMAHTHLPEDRAFTLLRDASQHLNVKLRDLADTVVETGQIPTRTNHTG